MNKNLIFYSNYPGDNNSQLCLDALNKCPSLNKQFIRICIHDPRDPSRPPPINLPPRVFECKRRGLMPILAISGFNEPIFANDALSWIQNTSLSQKEDVIGSNIHGQGTADNCCTISQTAQGGNELFETDYNIGFSSGDGEFGKMYSSINEAASSRIVTFDNDSKDKTRDEDEIQRRLDQLRFDREADVPRTMARVGGIAPPGQMQSGGGGMPMMPMMPPLQGQQGMHGGRGMMPMMPQHQGQGQGYGYGYPMQMQGGRGHGMPMMPQQGHGQGRGMPMMPPVPPSMYGRR